MTYMRYVPGVTCGSHNRDGEDQHGGTREGTENDGSHLQVTCYTNNTKNCKNCFCRNSLQEMILQDRVSSTPGKNSTGDFLKGVAENIITMNKIVEVTHFQFEVFLKWLCLPNNSSISDTAEMLETFCKDVNEATTEVLKEIAKGERKKR